MTEVEEVERLQAAARALLGSQSPARELWGRHVLALWQCGKNPTESLGDSLESEHFLPAATPQPRLLWRRAET